MHGSGSRLCLAQPRVSRLRIRAAIKDGHDVYRLARYKVVNCKRKTLGQFPVEATALLVNPCCRLKRSEVFAKAFEKMIIQPRGLTTIEPSPVNQIRSGFIPEFDAHSADP